MKNEDLPNVIRTDRLTLRPLADDDAPAIFDIFSRDEVAKWSGDGIALASIAEARAKVDRYQSRGGGRRGLGAFGVVDNRAISGPVIAVVLLVPIPASAGVERDDVEIGWHFHPEVWGRGYATEAARALVQRATALGLPEVVAVTNPDNAASQAVCKRLRMRDLGLLNAWYDKRLRAFSLGLTPDR